MPPTDKKSNHLSDELLDAVKAAAGAEQRAAEVREPPPDFVEIDGVKYYRHKPGGARESLKADDAGVPFEWVTLDLAPHANEIRLDGKRFFHGQTYEVAKSVADVLRDTMARTWDHEKQTGGANVLNGGRQQGRGFHLGPNGTVSAGARA